MGGSRRIGLWGLVITTVWWWMGGGCPKSTKYKAPKCGGIQHIKFPCCHLIARVGGGVQLGGSIGRQLIAQFKQPLQTFCDCVGG